MNEMFSNDQENVDTESVQKKNKQIWNRIQKKTSKQTALAVQRERTKQKKCIVHHIWTEELYAFII